MPIKVMLVDDHAVVRDGLQLIMEAQGDIQVLACADDGPSAIDMAERLRPDIIVMDIAMPGMNGIEAAVTIIAQQPAIKIIILTMYESPEHIKQAVKSGVLGFLLKKSAGSEIVQAVRDVAKGYPYFGKGVEELANQCFNSGETGQSLLSRREQQILRLVVEGRASKEIADILFISPKSVETYRSRLMKKLGVDNIVGLVKMAIKMGIVSDSG